MIAMMSVMEWAMVGWLGGPFNWPGQLANVAGSVADKAPIEISVFLTFDTSS